jgi:hypothetical protein
VIVSTDDPEIAEVAKKFGAEVPFMRPDEFAQDQTLDLPVFEHALNWLIEHETYRPDVVVQLRPTSPIRPRVGGRSDWNAAQKPRSRFGARGGAGGAESAQNVAH